MDRRRRTVIGGATALAAGLCLASIASTAPASANVGWGDDATSCADGPAGDLSTLQAWTINAASGSGTAYLGAGADITGTTSLDIPTTGPVTIDLCGGRVAITIPATSDDAGVHVPVGAALTIADSIGGGTLTVDETAVHYGGAAIGGGLGEGAGAITIDGGAVTARVGTYSGAAIGGGYGGHGITVTSAGDIPGDGGTGGDGGTVTVNGGSLTAIATTIYTGAAIGGGFGGFGGLNLMDSSQGAGGDGGDGGTLVVNGGTVEAIAADALYGATAIGGGSAGFGSRNGTSGAGATVVVNGGTLLAQSHEVTIGSGVTTRDADGAPGSLAVAGEWIDGVAPTKPAAISASAAPAVAPAGGSARFTITNGTAGGSLTTRIEFVDALTAVAPSATSAELGDTITVTGKAHVPSGATFDVSSALVLSSDVPEDVVSGNTVTFRHASPHTITVSYAGAVTSFTVEVSAPPVLAATGADPVPWLAAGAVLLLLGAALVLARRHIRG